MDMMCGDCLVHYGGGPLQFHGRNLPESRLEVRSESSPGGLEQSQRVHAAAKAKGIDIFQAVIDSSLGVTKVQSGGVVGISVHVFFYFLFNTPSHS
jgi:hypothetical protein